MHERETIELFLLGLEEGMTVSGATELAGVARQTAAGWAEGRRWFS